MCKQALVLVADLLDCEIGDAQEVLRLVQLHGEEVPRNAREFAKEAGRPVDFPGIIHGVQAVVVGRLAGDDSGLRSRLQTVTINDRHRTWGAVVDHGEASEQEAAQLAEVMMRGLKSRG